MLAKCAVRVVICTALARSPYRDSKIVDFFVQITG